MQTVLGESRDDLAREALQPVANENDANQPDYSLTAMDAMGKVVHRNDPCPCGSGLKYKQCHGKLG